MRFVLPSDCSDIEYKIELKMFINDTFENIDDSNVDIMQYADINLPDFSFCVQKSDLLYISRLNGTGSVNDYRLNG